jgi:hypothetical protein
MLPPAPVTSDLGMVLGGGGARGAYQVGVLHAIAARYPTLQVPILVGVSAGAVNATHLAAHRGTFAEAMDALVQHWLSLTPDQVFRVDASSLAANVMRSGLRLVAGGQGHPEQFQGMVDTAPLRQFLERVLERNPDGTLPGIAHNLDLTLQVAVRSLRKIAASDRNEQGRCWWNPSQQPAHAFMQGPHQHNARGSLTPASVASGPPDASRCADGRSARQQQAPLGRHHADVASK